MLQNLKNIAVVSLSTVGSRLLGLLRDILIFAALGAGLWNSAFILAFMLPNLFRRLLGEGALTSAVVPVFSDVLERDGRALAFGFLNQVLLRLFLFLVVFIAAGMVLMGLLVKGGWLPERWDLGLGLAVVMLPYMLFICLAAIVSAGLNLVGRFAAAAATPMLLNLSMIGALAAGMWLSDEKAVVVYWLCGGVLFGGLLQLALPAWDLYRQGWRPKSVGAAPDALRELWLLFLPGLMGAAILQLNILISRTLAYSLNESAASVLYLASRLMELPLGIFTVAVATVFFPLLARAVAAGDRQGFADGVVRGMRLVVVISLPAGVGLWVLGEPILELLFRWGAFDAEALRQTVPLIAIYGIGLPFYSAATFATRGLHAHKDMRSPVWVAGVCLLVNLLAGIVLMQRMGTPGLALANVFAAIVQAVLLWRAMGKHSEGVGFKRLRLAFAKICLAGAIMGLACAVGQSLLNGLALPQKLAAALVVGVLIPFSAFLYFAILWLLRFEEIGTLTGLLRRLLPTQR